MFQSTSCQALLTPVTNFFLFIYLIYFIIIFFFILKPLNSEQNQAMLGMGLQASLWTE